MISVQFKYIVKYSKNARTFRSIDFHFAMPISQRSFRETPFENGAKAQMIKYSAPFNKRIIYFATLIRGYYVISFNDFRDNKTCAGTFTRSGGEISENCARRSNTVSLLCGQMKGFIVVARKILKKIRENKNSQSRLR